MVQTRELPNLTENLGSRDGEFKEITCKCQAGTLDLLQGVLAEPQGKAKEERRSLTKTTGHYNRVANTKKENNTRN